jgi:hypothetical protein
VKCSKGMDNIEVYENQSAYSWIKMYGNHLHVYRCYQSHLLTK